ncbi:MAG: beta-lactamase family protein [Acidobacteria bacterium]|nr:beta-lactamase family protein [Acidobacteriota bacterium]
MRLLIAPLLTVLCLAAETLPTSTAHDAGLSAERLARIAPIMQKHVDEDRMAGAIGLIVRNGKAGYFETYGYQDREAKKAMRKDSIFRIYSMTKAVTGVAVMMMYEEGKFFLTDPVSKYLPEFKDRKVAPDGRTTNVVAAIAR